MIDFRVVVVALSLAGLSGCSSNGGVVLGEGTDHKLRIGAPTEDSAPMSLRVRQALKRNPQTSLENIEVSSQNDDVILLSGFVDTDAAKYEAERVAGLVDGVRLVINNLNVR